MTAHELFKAGMSMRVVTVVQALLLAGALVPAMAWAQSPAPASGIYTCTDARGRRLTSDRPIPECVDREQNLLNPSGTIKSKMGPELTPQQRAEAEAKEKQEATARALANEERRRERALLMRYPSKEVHDRERAEALRQIGVVMLAASKRVDDLTRERRKLDGEMEFYKKDPSKAPPTLRLQLDENTQATAAQRRFIAEQENEVRRVSTRFDEELARLTPLWLAQARPAPGAARPKRAP